MSGTFDADWLSLREPADHAARDGALERRVVERLASVRPAGRHLRIVDLGSGTGSNLRHLAPRLPGPQHWTLVDYDPALLAVAALRSGGAPPGEGEGKGEGTGAEPAGGSELRVETRALDLSADSASGLPAAFEGGVDLVTGSALLDLVSRDWLERLADQAVAIDAPVLIALSYDGRCTWEPAHPLDGAMRQAVNRHQRGTKSFGGALGPDAPAAFADAFRARGVPVEMAQSDWDLGPDAAPLQDAFARGWASAAVETGLVSAEAVADWLAFRIDCAVQDGARLVVGHQDVLALP